MAYFFAFLGGIAIASLLFYCLLVALKNSVEHR